MVWPSISFYSLSRVTTTSSVREINSDNTCIGSISGLQWDEYRKDCGFNAYARDPARAVAKFDRVYQNMGVSWDGYVIRVSLNEEEAINFAYHSSSIMIKMEPED